VKLEAVSLYYFDRTAKQLPEYHRLSQTLTNFSTLGNAKQATSWCCPSWHWPTWRRHSCRYCRRGTVWRRFTSGWSFRPSCCQRRQRKRGSYFERQQHLARPGCLNRSGQSL